MAVPQSIAWLALWFIFLPQNGVIYDPVQAKFQEVLYAAGNDDLPALLKRLDNLVLLDPSSPSAVSAKEITQALALLHPGLVADQGSRLQQMRAEATSNASLARAVKRLEILQEYYSSPVLNVNEAMQAKLSDPVFEGSLLGLQARADYAFQSGDYARAEYLAYQVAEAVPASPILANTYLMLGRCEAYKGNAVAAARLFQRSLAISPLPALRGRAQEQLATIQRFARPTPGSFGQLFDEESASRISAKTEIREPRGLAFHNGKYVLVDREQVLVLAGTGAVEEARGGREIEDVAVNRNGNHYYLREETLDLGAGNLIRLNLSIAGKERPLRKLRSLALDARGDLLMLDEEFGLLRAAFAGTSLRTPGVLSPTKGRLVRVDARGYIYLLGWDRKAIQILSREGKTLSLLSPATPGGREPSIQYFALDSQNHVFLLDTNSDAIQVFTVNETSSGLQSVKVSAIPLDARPHHKNLRVIAVSSTGELALTGRNDNHWVILK